MATRAPRAAWSAVAVSREVGPFGQILPHQIVSVVVGAALPSTVGLSEADAHPRRGRQGLMLGEFFAVVKRQCPQQMLRQGDQLSLRSPSDRSGAQIIDTGQECVTGFSFYQRYRAAAPSATDGRVSFPINRRRLSTESREPGNQSGAEHVGQAAKNGTGDASPDP